MLNQEQNTAVQHVEGPILLIAGAGSGKTRTLTHRIAHLLGLGVPASEILAVTFTNKAADEMRQRIQELAQVSILACTFHSLCARILRLSIEPLGFSSHFAIFDEEDSEKVLQQLVPDKDLLKRTKSAISQAKNQLLSPEEVAKEDADLGKLYADYQRKLKDYNALDFDDLLYQTVRLFQEFPSVLEEYQARWTFLLIDEYQDTNHAQYLLAKLLAARNQNIFAVGDPDQSIYSWRGADIQNILRFSEDYPSAKMLTLEENYRSTASILSAANGLIQHNQNRYEKNLRSARGEGEKVHVRIFEADREEVAFVVAELLKRRSRGLSFEEMAIFYRTHSQSRLFEDSLLKRGIPYKIVGGLSFYMRREVKDLLAYLRVAVEGRDFMAFARTINVPKRGIGNTTLEKLRHASDSYQGGIFALCEALVQGELSAGLSQKQKESLGTYVSVIRQLRGMIQQQVSIHILIETLIERIDYFNHLKEDPETYQERRENTQELVSTAAEWEAERGGGQLAAFLEEIALRSSHDKLFDQQAVRLMTIHNGKGLEFSLCFLVGMEEELFPHINSLDDPQALEEERRLAYVGMTRAKDALFLSAAKFRLLWGALRPMRPSRFLFELPAEHVDQGVRETAEGPIEQGDRVAHRDFGEGIVQKVYKTSLGETYDVYFPELGATRSLVARFAKLEKIGAHG